ncbi:MAG: hypothetical protein V1867_07425 [Candidatus Falkowbacteria bacterium]
MNWEKIDKKLDQWSLKIQNAVTKFGCFIGVGRLCRLMDKYCK